MTILCALLALLVANLVITITYLYELTIKLFIYQTVVDYPSLYHRGECFDRNITWYPLLFYSFKD